VPLYLAPHGSTFVVFRRPIAAGVRGDGRDNALTLTKVLELTGPWTVQFDPRWGGPSRATFETLRDWTKDPEPGIRFYSGTATYRLEFEASQDLARDPSRSPRSFLNLGAVKNLATVRLNGKDLGVLWTSPWRVELTGALRPGRNALEIDVANLWTNRLIGDAGLPPERRFTHTNVTTLSATSPKPFDAGSPLLPSGLLGPVVLERAEP
jgi:hypothetical protein